MGSERTPRISADISKRHEAQGAIPRMRRLSMFTSFPTPPRSRYSDHADYITNGTIQEIAIHFAKTVRQDYHSVRNQITRRVEPLASCKEFSAQEISDKNSVLGMHSATVRGLLNATLFSVESVMMTTAENERIQAILESKEYEKEIERSAPLIVMSQL
jgi:hypothetical protein